MNAQRFLLTYKGVRHEVTIGADEGTAVVPLHRLSVDGVERAVFVCVMGIWVLVAPERDAVARFHAPNKYNLRQAAYKLLRTT